MATDLVSSFLSEAQLNVLREAYKLREDQPNDLPAGQRKEQLRDKVKDELLKAYGPAEGYLNAVFATFFPDIPDSEKVLQDDDRERCIVAILAARDADFNLALHMYMAMMEGVSPAEIAHILLLTGVYGGVGSFSDGINIEVAVLKLLGSLVVEGPRGVEVMGDIDPPSIFNKLKDPSFGIRRY